jgi:Domain of unknown function (DUF6285)
VTDVADGADLLVTARDALLSELVPALDGERRYVALMIGNAMAIAAREAALGDETTRREVARLRALTTDIGPPDHPDIADATALRRRLAAAIRAGRFDDAAHAKPLVTALVETAADRLAISNPKALRR